MNAPELFDAHFHIVDPRFPLVENQGFLPDPFTCADYLAQARPLGVTGGAVVSGSFQGLDQTHLMATLAALGPGFVGVTQLPPLASDDEVRELDRCGVRAVRFNVRRGGSADVGDLEGFARRIWQIARWHVEIYIESRDLETIEELLVRLPRVSIDYLGLTREGLPTLLRLAERGVHVKATGFGRADFDVAPVLKDLARANPDCLMFGTDLPSTRSPRPFSPADVTLVMDALGPELARKALHDNAVAFYRPAARA
jgi:predicted TIM-barrel fold metal-dependent hydrolase